MHDVPNHRDEDPSIDGPVADESTERPQDDAVMARRTAFKRAAVGAAVVGAAWAAPRVEGLSVIPDFAAAATIGATNVGMSIDCKVPFTGSDFWEGGGATRVVTVPVPGGGNVSVTIPSGTLADSGANVPFTVSFAGWDPPFNRFNGGNMNFRGRNSGPAGPRNGPHGFGPLAPARTAGTLPSPTESTVSFLIPQGVNNVGPSPTGNTQWGDLNFTFSFGPA